MILDLYKSVATQNGIRDRRFRVSRAVQLSCFKILIFVPIVAYNCLSKGLQIEHAQHLAPGTAPRFGEQEIFASVQVFL